MFEKTYKDNITMEKSYVTILNFVCEEVVPRIVFQSNWKNEQKMELGTKNFLVNITPIINPTNFKEISTKNYWMNKNFEIVGNYFNKNMYISLFWIEFNKRIIDRKKFDKQ